MVKITYAPIGGYPTISSPNDINTSNITWWQIITVDQHPDPDAVIAGKISKHGKKITLSANNDTPSAKTVMLYKLREKLNTRGYYSEVSSKILDLIERLHVPIVTDRNKVERILGTTVNWLNDNGWYERNIDGVMRKKKLVGNPINF